MFKMSSQDGSVVIDIPNPDTDSAKGIITTVVNAARNIQAVVTSQKIGRDQDKTEMTWNYLEKEEWERMVRFWDNNFYFIFTYYSPVKGYKISRVFYIGDRNFAPYAVDDNGIPTAYKDCVANVIDTGVSA